MMCARRYIIVLLCFAAVLRASAQIQNIGWWKHSVFYQIYPRSFMDGDKDDGIGDLKGITSKLDHFADIGIKGIWLSPINKSPMNDFGYDISDFRDIQPEFGTLADLANLIEEARKLGLKVILDLVPNHTSDQHEWFKSSLKSEEPYKDYYIWVDPVKAGDTETPPNNWLSVFGDSAWKYHKERKQWYFHQFLPEQPDLNYRNPKVREEMEDIITYWLRKGIDGFRIDAVPHLYEINNITLNEPESGAINVNETEYAFLNHIYTKDQPETYRLVEQWRKLVDGYANTHKEDEKILMTEAYTTLDNTVKFYESGSHVPFNFKFITDVNSKSSAADFKNIIDNWINKMPEGGVANWVMGNHDRKRTATRYPDRGDQMTMLEMILPGVAVTYYGEEIGMLDNDAITYAQTKDVQACKLGPDNYKLVSRDPCRTPFQWNASENAGFSNTKEGTWLPIHKNYETLNLASQETDSLSHYNLYKNLTSLRNSTDVLKNGSYASFVVNNGNLLIVARYNDDEAVMLLINFSDKDAQTIDLSNVLSRTLVKTETLIASVGSNVGLNVEQKDNIVKVPAKASIILSSTFQSESNSVSKEHSDAFVTMILLLITVLAVRS